MSEKGVNNQIIFPFRVDSMRNAIHMTWKAIWRSFMDGGLITCPLPSLPTAPEDMWNEYLSIGWSKCERTEPTRMGTAPSKSPIIYTAPTLLIFLGYLAVRLCQDCFRAVSAAIRAGR